jgi:uncharacterized membrane protein
MWAWFRRSFIAGFFVTVPLAVSIATIIWFFRFIDGLTSGIGEKLLGRPWPGFGIIVTAAIILAIGALTANVFGQRILNKSEQWLLHVPVFKTIYAPVRQLLGAFSPNNEFGFKRMVIIQDANRGSVLGFLTKEFTVDRGHGVERLLAVYVPTNHLYLGDIILCTPERAAYPDMSVEEGIRVFLTGGTGMPDKMRMTPGHM